MHKANWQNLNRMPVAYRKKTNDINLLAWNRLLQQIEKKERKDMLSVKEAKELAEESKYYSLVWNKDYETNSFSTLEGKNFLNQEGAKTVFINICRQESADIAAQVVTIWHNNSWMSIFDAYPLFYPEK